MLVGLAGLLGVPWLLGSMAILSLGIGLSSAAREISDSEAEIGDFAGLAVAVCGVILVILFVVALVFVEIVGGVYRFLNGGAC